jgi:hypothetical protein
MLTFLAGDFDQNGAVDNDDYNVWRADFGNISDGPEDRNGDSIVDAADYVIWRKNFGKITADLPPHAPFTVSAAATGATSIQVNWETVSTAISYSVQRRQPDTESEFTTLASGVATTTYTDSTAISDTLYEYRVVAANANGDSPASQLAQATTNQSNLTAYRPQSVQDPNNPTNSPIYDPFPKKPVLEGDEENSSFGPGIRINFDDDNSNGTPDVNEAGIGIALENDLIEVKVDRLPGVANLVLQAGPKLMLFYDHDKTTPIPLTGGTSAPLNFTNNTVTVFVEWIDSNHGTDTLSLINPATMTTLDTIRFHSFRSLTVVFGGRGQNPKDTDGDGSIGDHRGGPAANREGIFDLAQVLYDSGWDVMAFDEADYSIFTESVAEREIKNAIDNRFVDSQLGGGVSIMGYSQDGGVVQNIIEDELDPINNPQYLPVYGVYLDAVVHDSVFSETDWPDVVFYLLNIYQQNSLLGGDDIDDNEVLAPAVLEEINTTTDPGFPANLDHQSIDDDIQVLQRIILRQNQLLLR